MHIVCLLYYSLPHDYVLGVKQIWDSHIWTWETSNWAVTVFAWRKVTNILVFSFFFLSVCLFGANSADNMFISTILLKQSAAAAGLIRRHKQNKEPKDT